MISCEECQKKLAAIFDNEGFEDDEEFTKAHLRDCQACRAFREDMVRLRQWFVSVDVPDLPKGIEKELMRVIRADFLRRENRLGDNRLENQQLLLRFPRLAWAAGLAALFIIIVSWLACYMLAREVSDLKGQLDTSRQELTAVRQDLAVTQATKQREEDRQREQKAISELHSRVRELEGQVQRGISPRMAWLSESPDYRPERPAGL